MKKKQRKRDPDSFRHAKTTERFRECSVCGVVLSIYNHSPDKCFQHKSVKIRDKKSREVCPIVS